MSRQDDRQAIADAASTVDGITCSPNFVQSTRPGDAMVRFDHGEFPNPFAQVSTWQVAVVLPQDYAAAEQFIDERVSDLCVALAGEMTITRVTPAQLALSDATVPVVFIEGVRGDEPLTFT